MRHVLVTGGAGYIGSHTCKALAIAGFVPVAYDNLSTGHAYAVKWGPFVQGDILDAKTLGDAMETFRPEAVFHFAAKALVIESMNDPSIYYANNVVGTHTLLDAMKKHAINQLIFSSSCASYGEAKWVPITEDHPQAPINPYGRTKWLAEQMVADFSAAYDLKAIGLRYFNVAGADLEGEAGEDHEPETHLVPLIIQTAMQLRSELAIYGKEFPTRDGSAIRDYLHVQDLAEAHVLALQHLTKTKKSDVFNLGTGRGASVLEMIAAVEAYCGKTIPVRLEKTRPGEPAMLTASGQKAEALLGWRPRHSDVRTLVESAWKWHAR